MNITRKQFVESAARSRLRALAACAWHYAQDYPSQDIRMIVGFPAGSGADIMVRYFAEKLRPIAGRTVIVENKPGANSNVATEFVARSKPDGHVLYQFAGTTVRGKHAPVQEAARRCRYGAARRRHHQQSCLHARG